MGNTIEQHRSAIGRFKPSGRRRVSAKTIRGRVLSDIMAIISVVQIRREAKQVDTEKNKYKFLKETLFCLIAGLARSIPVLCPLCTLVVHYEGFSGCDLSGNFLARSHQTA